MLSPSERLNRKLWHAIAGAAFLKLELHITDEDIIGAVRWHTTGKANMIWDRVINIIDKNDYQGCREGFIEIFAIEVPFTEEEFDSMKREDLYEKAFQAAMAGFKRKTDRLAEVAMPVIKQVYENQGQMYENILLSPSPSTPPPRS